MLEIIIPEREFFNEETNEFSYTKSQILQLEHSLVSLSKWEAKWTKPFMEKDNKSNEEIIDYIRCMTVTQNIKPEVYDNLPPDIINKIKEYIDAKMTATWFTEKKPFTKSKEIITSELIYYWMIINNIPMECQKWHLNRLITLIRVCGIKNSPQKKRMNRQEMLANRRALNDARRAQLNTKG